MSQHSDPAIPAALDPQKLAALREQLNIKLQQAFEKGVGYPLPSITHAEIREVDVAMKYVDEVRPGEFQAGVRQLVTARFHPSSEIFKAAIRVTGNVLKVLDHDWRSSTIYMEIYSEAIPVYSGQNLSRMFFVVACAAVQCPDGALNGRRFLISEYAFTVFNIPLNGILGKYECHEYDGTPNKNDYHYVTISRVSDVELEWTTKGGVKWKLTATPDRTKLSVGPESPYFKDGYYTVAEVAWEGSHVSGLYGPGHQFFKKYA